MYFKENMVNTFGENYNNSGLREDQQRYINFELEKNQFNKQNYSGNTKNKTQKNIMRESVLQQKQMMI